MPDVDSSGGSPSRIDHINWRLPLYAGLIALAVYLPITVYGSDMDEILYLFVLAPIIGFVLLLTLAIRKKPRQRVSTVLMFLAYVVVTGTLGMSDGELRPALRWLLWSDRYKAEVLTLPDSTDGDLKRVEWDGWGFAGNDTVAYLVFDPTDSLAPAAKRGSSGKFRGIPCEVSFVRRLESRWYSVVLYTNADWDHCS